MPSISIPFGSAGKYGYVFDKETGLYFLKSRYYDPDTARFTSKDRFKGFENRPASQNPYTYCENDPTNNFDLNGFISIKLKWFGIRIYYTHSDCKKIIDVNGKIGTGTSFWNLIKYALDKAGKNLYLALGFIILSLDAKEMKAKDKGTGVWANYYWGWGLRGPYHTW